MMPTVAQMAELRRAPHVELEASVAPVEAQYELATHAMADLLREIATIVVGPMHMLHVQAISSSATFQCRTWCYATAVLCDPQKLRCQERQSCWYNDWTMRGVARKALRRYSWGQSKEMQPEVADLAGAISAAASLWRSAAHRMGSAQALQSIQSCAPHGWLCHLNGALSSALAEIQAPAGSINSLQRCILSISSQLKRHLQDWNADRQGHALQLNAYGCNRCNTMMHLWATSDLLAARMLRSLRASTGKFTV